MTSSTGTVKVLCNVCNKAQAIFKCQGCSKLLCPNDSVVHRNELNKALEETEVAHDVVHQELNKQAQEPRQHPLMIQVDKWEQESILQIRQLAEEIRSKLHIHTIQHTDQLKEKLKFLSNELKQARENNDFSEIDLQQWRKNVEQLKQELINPMNIKIREDSMSLVNKIVVDSYSASDIFDRICGNAQIEEYGRLVVKDNSADHAQLRGKHEYSSGKQTIHFNIEHLFENPWIFFGIINKSQPMQENSYSSTSCYGWATVNQIYANGQCQNGTSGDAMQNDTVSLLIDCDQRRIELKNLRTNHILQMPVNLNTCPFPWQFHVNIYARNTRVRILSNLD